MAGRKPEKSSHYATRHPFDTIALVLQGGGALGAYQCGVYEALAKADVHPDWVAGISIGAINAAIIAGNPTDKRLEKLHAFWDLVTANPFDDWADIWFSDPRPVIGNGNDIHGAFNQLSSFQTSVAGAPGFFSPRFPSSLLFPGKTPASVSFYDTSALAATIESLVDFDLINSKATRLSVGAVNVRTGNFTYFDTETHTIGPKHILASGALPPGFPAVEIDGEFYWDGGLVSNTPLQWVVDAEPRRDMLAFQVDLWSSRGNLPHSLPAVATRQKDIQYSSRTRASTDQLNYLQKIRSTVTKLLKDLPADILDTEEGRILTEFADIKVYNVVQLIYRSKAYEGYSKDYEFSRSSMTEHWRAGLEDANRALQHKEIFVPPTKTEGFRAFDFGWPYGVDHESEQQRKKHL